LYVKFGHKDGKEISMSIHLPSWIIYKDIYCTYFRDLEWWIKVLLLILYHLLLW